MWNLEMEGLSHKLYFIEENETQVFNYRIFEDGILEFQGVEYKNSQEGVRNFMTMLESCDIESSNIKNNNLRSWRERLNLLVRRNQDVVIVDLNGRYDMYCCRKQNDEYVSKASLHDVIRKASELRTIDEFNLDGLVDFFRNTWNTWNCRNGSF